MNRILHFLFFWGAFATVLAQNSTLPFRHLTVDSGLPHTDATQVLQDEKGFIWISTYAGLNRFDGYEIKNFVSKKYHLQNVYLNRINHISYDNHKIWLATQGGIAYFDSKKEEVILPKFDINTNFNYSHIKTHKNRIYAITDGKLQIFELENGVAKNIKFQASLPSIYSLDIDKNGKVYLATTNGLYRYFNGTIEKYLLNSTQKQIELISFVGFDNDQNLIIGVIDGIAFIPKNSISQLHQTLEVFSFSQQNTALEGIHNQIVSSVVKGFRSDYWVSTPNGILKFDLNNKSFAIPSQANSLSSKFTNNLLIDNSGTLWVSTYGGGVNYIDLTPKLFNTIRFTDNSSNYIRAIYEDDLNGNLWIGTRTEGLVYYDFQTKNYQKITTQNNLCSNYIRSITKDKSGKLWVGTENGISILSGKTVIKNLQKENNNPQTLTNNVIFSMSVDVFGQIWAGSWQNGLNRIKEEKGQFIIQKIDDSQKMLSGNKVTFVYTDPVRPEVFVGTTKGLDHFYLNADGSVAKVFHYVGRENDAKSISSNFIWPIIRTDVNTLWVGTIGGGVNKITLNHKGGYSAEIFDIQNGLPSNDVETLLHDNNGNIWIGGRGLSMLNPTTKQIIKYDVNDGLQSNIFKIGSAFKGRDGRMYFGGVNGLNYFYPNQIQTSRFVSPIVFSDILINNSTAKINDDELEESLPFLEKIKLNYTQNNLIIKFASLDFANAEKCLYRYKLLGFNQDWVVTDAKNRRAAFSNLDFGEYTLQLQSTNHDGIWMDKTKELRIVITPPWWKSIWAKLFYFGLVGFIIYLIYKYQLSWLKLNQKLEIKEIEKKNEEELHQLRMQFFTNISHELRTPLSLIISPTEKLLQEELDKPAQIRLHQLIQRNANRLLNLVNELLEFRKAEAGMMKIKASEIGLSAFLNDISSEFDEVATEKNIHFIKNLNSSTKLWIDQNILGKVIVNLLSNAFKYTPENSEVRIELIEKPSLIYKNIYEEGTFDSAFEYQWIRVADNGIGIDTDSLNHVFERFYRVTDAEKDNLPGSGIGLAFVRSLVLIHKGLIKASSEPQKGTEFLIGLPTGDAYLSQDEIQFSRDYSLDDSLIKAIETNDFLKEEIEITRFTDENPHETRRKLKLLVVEDNEELRHFVSDSFIAEFNVLMAKDGEEGLKMVKEELPDIIISDVMMPKMDGFDLCKAIKSNIEISHIPVILLTAKNSDESKISGSEVGADSYITKPFSLKLLQLTVSNILESRKRLKEMYAHDIFVEAREMGTTKRDKEFIDYLISIVEEHLDDTNLDVDLICNKVGMSRTKLYSKIQSLTGQPVGEFIRKLRLKKAAQIIVSEDVSITEVMEKVGIQSQSYFTKAFKKEFGKTPTKFLHDYIIEQEMKQR